MADPLIQLVEWLQVLTNRFAVPLALGIGLYWAWVLWNRTQDTSDPSIRKFSSSGVGSMSFLVSGAYFSALLAGTIALVTWPAPLESPLIGVLLVGGVAFHAAMEAREDRMEGAG
jgi:hypothetical protein